MKRFPIILLLFCAPVHTWAQKAEELTEIEVVSPSQASRLYPYLSSMASIRLNKLTGAPEGMKLNLWGSRSLNNHLYYNIPTKVPYLTVSVGGGIVQEVYDFSKLYTLQRGEDRKSILQPPKEAKVDTIVNEEGKSKVNINGDLSNVSLSVTHIELVVPELRVNTNRQAPASGFFLAFGNRFGLRWGPATQYTKYKEDDELKTATISETFNLNNFHWGFTVRLGWERFSIFYAQNLTGLFHKNMGPSEDKIKPWSVGISVSLL